MSESDNLNTREVTNKIVKALGEEEKKPRRQIANIVKLCGAEFALRILEETEKIEEDGGMLTNDGKRRRTKGGVFFLLAKDQMPEEQRQEVFYSWKAQAVRRAEREAKFPEFNYNEERRAVVHELLQNAGKVTDVNVNLIGRPAAIERRRNLVILTMREAINEEMVLPNGVPQPDPRPIDYSVYISAKQWERVEKAIENDEDDDLIIEGLIGFDDETDSMAIYATFVTTQKIQRKKKKQDKQNRKSDNGNGSSKPAPKPAKRDAKPPRNQRQHRPPPTPADFDRAEEPEAPAEAEIDIQLPDGIPADAAEKLTGLYKAAATFRQKIAALEAKPADEQFGLEMTQKLLKNTEAQIEKIEQEFK